MFEDIKEQSGRLLLAIFYHSFMIIAIGIVLYFNNPSHLELMVTFYLIMMIIMQNTTIIQQDRHISELMDRVKNLENK